MDMIEWFVGVDWGSEAHQVCIIDGEGSVRGERSFTHTGSGLAEMAAWLLAQAGAAADVIGVAIEVPHGPVVEALMEHGFVVHSLNPKQLDRFRDRFSPAGAKDDRRDARVLADALRTDRRFFRRLDPVDPEVVELREWTRIADDLTAERTRLVNRVRQQLWRYYPQVLAVEGDLAKAWLLELWQLAPTPAKARRVRKDTIARLLKRHRVRCIDAGEVLRRLREPAIPVAPGTTEAAVAHIRSVAERLALVRRQLAQAHQQMDSMTKALAASMENQEVRRGDQDETRTTIRMRSAELTGAGESVQVRREGKANHYFHRKPCGRTREGAVEASVAARVAGMIEHRKRYDPERRGFLIDRRQHLQSRHGEGLQGSALSEESRDARTPLHRDSGGLQFASAVVPGPRKKGDNPNR